MILLAQGDDLYVLALAVREARLFFALLPASRCGAESAFEMPAEMALIGKADGSRNISGRHAVAEHVLGAIQA